jgi:hypothetical protein
MAGKRQGATVEKNMNTNLPTYCHEQLLAVAAELADQLPSFH